MISCPAFTISVTLTITLLPTNLYTLKCFVDYTVVDQRTKAIIITVVLLYLKKAFGAQEWFIRLAVGYTAEPNFFSEAVSTVPWPLLRAAQDSWALSNITTDTK